MSSASSSAPKPLEKESLRLLLGLTLGSLPKEAEIDAIAAVGEAQGRHAFDCVVSHAVEAAVGRLLAARPYASRRADAAR
jgi:hypothetical protein